MAHINLLSFYKNLDIENYKKVIFFGDIEKILTTEVGKVFEKLKVQSDLLADLLGYAKYAKHVLNVSQEKIQIDKSFNVKEFLISNNAELYENFLRNYNFPKKSKVSLKEFEIVYFKFISVQNLRHRHITKKLELLKLQLNDLVREFFD